jgi:hypothetical protein
MALDINNKNTDSFVDEYGIMMTQNPTWNPNGNNGMGDCIGRTLDAYLAYEYEPFIDAVKNCYILKTDKKGTYIQGYRHPTLKNVEYNDLSRDHILNTLILMKLTNNTEFLELLSNSLRWKISDRFNFTIELWFWMKGIAGNKFNMFLYYLVDIPMMFFSIIWNKIIFKLGEFNKEVSQDEFIIVQNENKTKKQKFFEKLVYPIYTLYQKSFMMYVSPDSFGKWIMKKICLWNIDKQNFLLRIMFGDKNVDKEKVYSYKSMTAWRWSTYLNEMNDRDLHIITNPILIEANTLDVDLLRKMYEKTK